MTPTDPIADDIQRIEDVIAEMIEVVKDPSYELATRDMLTESVGKLRKELAWLKGLPGERSGMKKSSGGH